MNAGHDDSLGLVRQTRLILNRVTSSRVEEEAGRLIRVMEAAGVEETSAVVELILAKAISECDRTDVYSELVRRVVKGSDSRTMRVFKRDLHERCELAFNRFLPDSDQACAATKGICTFITQLYLHRVMSPKIVQSCVIHCLFGATASRDHVPSPLCIEVLHRVLSLAGAYLKQDAPSNLQLYVTRLEELHVEFDPPTTLLIDHLLQLHADSWPDTSQQAPLLSRPHPVKTRLSKGSRSRAAADSALLSAGD